jgi:cytochrome P450
LKVHDAATPGAAISGGPAPQGTTADLVDPWLYSGGDAHAVWRRMREQETLTRQEVDDEGDFWNIVGFDDAEHVLRDTGTFTSERGTMLGLLGTDDPAGGKQLAVTDPPRHTEMQTRLKKALAVKAAERQKDMIRPLVLDLIAPLGDGGAFDFAETMLAMPMSVTGTMMALPAADWPWLSRLTTICIAADGPNYVMAEFIDKGVLEDWAAHPEVNTTATEEALRWASPVNHFLRYATRDVEVRNTKVSAGDAVVVWLGSANRDEAAFTEAGTFDIRRRPNKHVAFGIGPHHCIGHSVARITLRILFEELLTRFEDFRPAGKPERLASNFVSGGKHVPITARPRAGAPKAG